MTNISERVKGNIAKHLGIDRDKVTEDANFIDDLGADSGQLRSKNLIAALICLAVLPCFALFAVASRFKEGYGTRGCSN
jgi:hypothetical protein